MKKILLTIAMSIVLAGCASSSSTQYYRLPDSALKSNTQLNKTAVSTQVILANYLQSNSMVYEIAPNQMQFTQNNMWAESLPTALQNSVLNKLNQNSHQYRFVGDGGNSRQLQIYVQSFYGSHTGDVVLEGYAQWLQEGKTIRNQNFTIRQAQAKDGYPAMLNAMNQALAQLAAQLMQ